MNNLLRKLDLTTIAYVAAMVVLLSTMFLLIPFSSFAQGGDAGDGDGDYGGGYTGGDSGASAYAYIEANIKQIEVRRLTSEICRQHPLHTTNAALMLSIDQSKCVGVAYYVSLSNGMSASFIRTDSMSLSEFYSQIRNSGFTGEMNLLMQMINRIGRTPGVYVIAHTATGFTINGGNGSSDGYGNEFDDFNNSDYDDEDYWDDIDDLYDNLNNDTTLTNNNQALLTELKKLLDRLEELRKKLAELQRDNDDPKPEGSKPWCASNVWARDLQLGDEGEDVRILQKFLNSIPGIVVANTGPGSRGLESTFFGFGTQRALIKFQEMHLQDSATGYFGSMTKDVIRNQCNAPGDDVATSFKLTDVKMVTMRTLDVNDNEFDEYTITLKSGKVIKVNIRSQMSELAVMNAFRKVGYTGDIDDLMDMAEEDDGDSTASYGLNDVEMITMKEIDPLAGAIDDEYTLYTITLESGRKIEVRIYGNMISSQIRDAFRNTGYTGDVDDLMDEAEEDEGDTFALRDIESVTKEYVDPSEMMADEEYSLYVVTLKNDTVIEFRVAVYTVAGALEARLREVGYTGDIDDFVDMVETIESDNDFGLSVNVSGMTATARFEVTNGCTGYLVEWGDGSTDIQIYAGGNACTQVMGTITLDHEYDEAGTYEVEVTLTTGSEREVATRTIRIND